MHTKSAGYPQVINKKWIRLSKLARIVQKIRRVRRIFLTPKGFIPIIMMLFSVHNAEYKEVRRCSSHENDISAEENFEKKSSRLP